MKLLAIDPGGTTGFSIFNCNDNANQEVIRWKKIKIGCRTEKEDVFDLLRTVSTDHIICEDFRLFPWKSMAQGWSQLDTVRIIGAIEHFCWQEKIPLTMQTTGNRDIGYRWGQVPELPKSNPSNHAHDAWAHAVFWIISRKGVIIE